MRRLMNWVTPHLDDIPESERSVQSRARAVAWIGTVAFAMVLTLVEMGLEWGAPEGARGYLRPVVFTLAALLSTAMVMRASYRESAKFYVEQAQLNHALEHQALFDALTDLPNRRQFYDRLRRSLDDNAGVCPRFALLMIDLDGFKDINDTFGHAAGDLLLQEIAHRLQMAIRAQDLVARLGGDEFAMLLADQSAEAVLRVADRLVDVLAEPLLIEGDLVSVSASIGIAHCPEHGTSGDLLMRHADLAMYAAKRTGGAYAVYTADLELVRQAAAAA